MTISICLGSSCHVKGSKDIVEMLKAAIAKNGLEDKVKLSGSVCLGKCSSGGVNMKIDDEIVEGVKRETFDQFFEEKVLKRVK